MPFANLLYLFTPSFSAICLVYLPGILPVVCGTSNLHTGLGLKMDLSSLIPLVTFLLFLCLTTLENLLFFLQNSPSFIIGKSANK